MATLPKIRLKAEVPESLKQEIAATTWGRVLSVTPVVMTVIATMLAGLASSEMTRAQYDRSLAAQRQSKAGDQWNFFQGKRLRAVVLRSTLDNMAGGAETQALDLAALRAALSSAPAEAGLAQAGAEAALAALGSGAPPKLPDSLVLPPAVQTALLALEHAKPESELAPVIARLEPTELDTALRLAQGQALALDQLTTPIGRCIDSWEKHLKNSRAGAALRRDFTAARLAYNAQRYDTEARLNQSIAGLYELQVRQSNLSAERHHRRSSQFFYGMLAAQLGVIVSTLAMAAHQRSLLWGIAASAGLVAIAFTVYVLLYV